MKTFITGASGFIGTRLAEKLAEEDHDITLLIRDNKKARGLAHGNFRIVNGDIFDNKKIIPAMEGCDWVFHLAAYAKPFSADKDLPYRTNTEGTKNILSLASSSAVKAVVVTSSAGTVGFSRDGLPVTEETNRNIDYHTEYERTKFLAEQAAFSASTEKMKVVVVNPSRVFGPGRLTKSNSLTRIIKLYGAGRWRIIPGDGTAIGNYAFVDDVVNGHILAAKFGTGANRYILGGENLSFDEFFNCLAKVYGQKRTMLKISSGNLRRINRVSAMFLAVAGRPPIITDSWIEKYLENWSLSCNKAVENLNYSITPFNEALEKTVKWLRSEKSF
jgi:farnesol dehydrogenase